jgi:hypothetical protein
MSQQRLIGSPEKTNQQIAHRESRPDSVRSFQGGLHPILQLQRTIGNRRVAQFIQAKRLSPQDKILGVQAKLTVGAAGDQYEQEADRVARQVITTPDAVAANSMQRAMSPEEDKDQALQTKPLTTLITPGAQRQIRQYDEEDKPIQAKSAGSLADSFEAGADVETQVSLSKGRGSPLPDPVRAYMEPRFGVDFSHVRVPTGGDAIQMNRDVGAQAFTHGSDIYFGEGRSPTNLELTAHELTHVVQQNGGAVLTQDTSSVQRQQQKEAGGDGSVPCFLLMGMKQINATIGNTKPLFTRAHPPEPPSTRLVTTPRHWEPTPQASPDHQLGSLAGSQQGTIRRPEYSRRPADDGGSERRQAVSRPRTRSERVADDTASYAPSAVFGAASLARGLNAGAFTQGQHVFLGARVDLSAPCGQETLAHEVTHVAAGRTGFGTVQRASQDVVSAPDAVSKVPVSLFRDSALLHLQRSHGRRFVQRFLAREMAAGERTGEAPVEGVPVKEEGEAAAPDLSQVNENGEIDGAITSNVHPHVFVNRGKTGSAMVHWVGGTGGMGNQPVGSIDLVAPVYENRNPAGSDPQGNAWIRPGTGTARVTRSFTGAPAGPNGPTAYLTTRGSIRADVHERLHIASSRTHHDTHIKPLERRVARHRGRSAGLSAGATGAEAQTALQTFVDWNTAVTNFANADTTDNTPGGTVDTNDLASGTYLSDFGPRVVRGVNYAHYYDTPPGP